MENATVFRVSLEFNTEDVKNTLEIPSSSGLHIVSLSNELFSQLHIAREKERFQALNVAFQTLTQRFLKDRQLSVVIDTVKTAEKDLHGCIVAFNEFSAQCLQDISELSQLPIADQTPIAFLKNVFDVFKKKIDVSKGLLLKTMAGHRFQSDSKKWGKFQMIQTKFHAVITEIEASFAKAQSLVNNANTSALSGSRSPLEHCDFSNIYHFEETTLTRVMEMGMKPLWCQALYDFYRCYIFLEVKQSIMSARKVIYSPNYLDAIFEELGMLHHVWMNIQATEAVRDDLVVCEQQRAQKWMGEYESDPDVLIPPSLLLPEIFNLSVLLESSHSEQTLSTSSSPSFSSSFPHFSMWTPKPFSCTHPFLGVLEEFSSLNATPDEMQAVIEDLRMAIDDTKIFANFRHRKNGTGETGREGKKDDARARLEAILHLEVEGKTNIDVATKMMGLHDKVNALRKAEMCSRAQTALQRDNALRELNKLKDNNSSLKEENQRLTEENGTKISQEALKSLRDEISFLRSQQSTLTLGQVAAAAEARVKEEEYRNNIQSLEDENKRLKELMRASQASAAKEQSFSEDQDDTLKQELVSRKAEYNKLLNQYRELQNQHAAFVSERNIVLDDYRTQLQVANDQIRALEQAHHPEPATQQSSAVSSLQQQNAVLSTQLREALAQIGAEKRNCENLRNRLLIAERTAVEAEERISRTQPQTTGGEDEIQALQAELTVQKEKCVAFSTTIEELNSQTGALQDVLYNQRKQNAAYGKSNGYSSSVAPDQFLNELDDVRSEKDLLLKTNEDLRSALTSAEENAENASVQNILLEEENGNLKRCLEALKIEKEHLLDKQKNDAVLIGSLQKTVLQMATERHSLARRSSSPSPSPSLSAASQPSKLSGAEKPAVAGTTDVTSSTQTDAPTSPAIEHAATCTENCPLTQAHTQTLPHEHMHTLTQTDLPPPSPSPSPSPSSSSSPTPSHTLPFSTHFLTSSSRPH
eukprot:GCRY01001767.1.p1 GENE.GCRY01001767.1~~GCRY01001767.1.p1  ORF type:complete len:983 (+),score=217.81 GCRY01001767.1:211-3159(+)